MAATKFGVVYSTINVHIRRFVYPQDDSMLVAAQLCVPGESLVLVSRGPYASTAAYYAAINAAVTAAAGQAPATNLDCAVIDGTNTVVNMIKADALIDSVPGMTLVQSYDPRIIIGCTYDPIAMLFTVPAYTIPAFTDRHGNVIASVNVPALLIPRS